jgi:tetratricopeptide (TPR) repeat protein
MKKNILLPLLALLFSSTQLIAQKNDKAEESYTHALQLYEQKQTAAAASEFEKVLAIIPRHKDAMFNLAVLNFDLGNKDRAMDLLQACVRLGDRNAADLLKEQLQQKIAFADTMDYDDVDIRPKVMVNFVQEEVIVNKGLNKAIVKSLRSELKKSKLLRKQVGVGNLLVLSMYFGRDGILNAEILGANKNGAAQEEVTSVLRRVVQTVPGKHEGKEVVVRGLALPITM